MQNYGYRLKEARKAKKLTQTEAAELIGLQQQAWQRLEAGKLDPKMSTIYNVCKGLEISADWLLGLAEEGSEHVTQ